MGKLEVFDPPMCCTDGLCGKVVDPTLHRFRADLEWLTDQGVAVRRHNLSEHLAAFADNDDVRAAVAHEADDLTQDTLVRAQNNVGGLLDHSKLLGGLYRIATNICYDRFRQASYRHRPQSLDLQAHAAGVPDTAPRLDKTGHGTSDAWTAGGKPEISETLRIFFILLKFTPARRGLAGP